MSAMTLIEHIESPAGGFSQVNLTSIPQTYTDLMLLISFRSSYGQVAPAFGLHLNGISSNHKSILMYGTGTSAGGFPVTNRPYDFFPSGSPSTNNTFGNALVLIPNYAGSKNKSLYIDSVSENDSNTVTTAFVTATWSNTAAITSIEIIPDSASTIVEHSSVSLYGILAGSDGTTTVS